MLLEKQVCTYSQLKKHLRSYYFIVFFHLSSGETAISGAHGVVPDTLIKVQRFRKHPVWSSRRRRKYFDSPGHLLSVKYLSAIVNENTLDFVFEPQPISWGLRLDGTGIKHACSLYFMKGEKSCLNIPVNINSLKHSLSSGISEAGDHNYRI